MGRTKKTPSRYQQQLMNEVDAAGREIDTLARNIIDKKTTKGIPFAGSKTAAALAKAFEEPVEFQEADLAEELKNDTGDCLNKLAYYDVNMSAAAADKTLFHNMQFPVGGVTYDDVTVKGTIALDERAALMASVGTAMVICKILHGVKSKSYYDDSGLENKLIYLEDIVDYIHSHFGDVITLDATSSAAFERMTREQRMSHERKLLKDILTQCEDNTLGTKLATQNFDTSDVKKESFYNEKLKAMSLVASESVGKVWSTDGAGAGAHGRNGDALAANKAESWYTRTMIDTARVIVGSPRIKISSNLKIQTATPNTLQSKAFDVAVVILSLVAFHVLTYANTAALDFYIKLARKGGYEVTAAGDKEVEFSAGKNNNVLTHSVFAPGLFAALRMYGITESQFDDEMAFQINTNVDVKALFKAAHEAYDSEGANKVGAKMFKSEVDTTPSWLVPKEKQLEYEQEFARTKAKSSVAVKIPDGSGSTRDFGGADVETDAVVKKVAASAALASNQNLQKYARGITGFGRRKRRSSKRASFGRRTKRSSKKTRKASFGRRKKNSKSKKTSFGRRKRRTSRR